MTKIPKKAPITLTGAVYDGHQDVPKDDPTSWIDLEAPTGGEGESGLTELGAEKLSIVYVGFNRGDVALYQRSDMFGRVAIRGGHTNYGYSGYFKASVFDGKRWRAFKIWNFIPEKDRHYANQGELVEVRRRLTALISGRAGSIGEWGHRAYELAVSSV